MITFVITDTDTGWKKVAMVLYVIKKCLCFLIATLMPLFLVRKCFLVIQM